LARPVAGRFAQATTRGARPSSTPEHSPVRGTLREAETGSRGGPPAHVVSIFMFLPPFYEPFVTNGWVNSRLPAKPRTRARLLLVPLLYAESREDETHGRLYNSESYRPGRVRRANNTSALKTCTLAGFRHPPLTMNTNEKASEADKHAVRRTIGATRILDEHGIHGAFSP